MHKIVIFLIQLVNKGVYVNETTVEKKVYKTPSFEIMPVGQTLGGTFKDDESDTTQPNGTTPSGGG